MVSPIPSASSVPRPTALFSEPVHLVPASVTPRCSGWSIFSAQQPVGGDRVGHAGRLHRDLEVLELEAMHELDPLGRGADERLDGVGELEVAQVLGQRARVDADAQRRPVALGDLDDLGRLLGAADVAGVDAHAVRAGLDRLDRQRVVEVDVGDHRDRRVAHDRLQRLDVLLARDGDADDVGAGLGDPPDLVHRRAEVRRLGLGHRLDGHGRAAPDGDAAHVDLPRGGHARSVRGTVGLDWQLRADVYGTARGRVRAAWPLRWPPAPAPGATRASSPSPG